MTNDYYFRLLAGSGSMAALYCLGIFVCLVGWLVGFGLLVCLPACLYDAVLSKFCLETFFELIFRFCYIFSKMAANILNECQNKKKKKKKNSKKEKIIKTNKPSTS